MRQDASATRPPILDYGLRGPYWKTPASVKIKYTLGAIGGFCLFFLALFLAFAIAGGIRSNGAVILLVLVAPLLESLLVAVLLPHRAWMTGWWLGFLLAAALLAMFAYVDQWKWWC